MQLPKLTSTLFASSFLLQNRTKFFRSEAECAEKEEKGSKEAEDLDKIFAQGGGMPPDPEEIQAIMAKMSGRKIQ